MQGHQRKRAMREKMREHFFWGSMDADVLSFCDSCIHCSVSQSGELVPQPLGHALHAERSNEMLHFDFCYMDKASTSETYVLIVKDGLSSYTWMFPCEQIDAETVADSLIDWLVAFGVFDMFVSDQGTHFKNDAVRTIQEKLRIGHHFTLPHCPWSNGTVEVVFRELLCTTKAILSELQLPF